MKVIIGIILVAHFSKALSQKCGIPEVQADLNVTLGPTESKSWPWQALLQFRSEPWCPATLISETWLLTTAKCASYRDFAIHSAVLMEGQLHAVDTVMVHPNYKPLLSENDIALVKLKTKVADKQPVCLPKSGNVTSAGQNCFVIQQNIEWVSDTANVRYEQRRVKLMENDECQRLKVTQLRKSVKDSILCAANDGSTGRYNGLLGGPLVCQSRSGSWTLYGIMSWLFRDAAGESYIAASKTEHFIHWIS